LGLKISSLLFSDVSDNAISKGVTYFSIISGLVVIFRNII